MLIKKFKSYFNPSKFFTYKVTVFYTKAYFFQNSHFNLQIGNKQEIKKNLMETFQILDKKILKHYDFQQGKFYAFDS